MIREILTSQPQQTLQHINPSHQDEPFQSNYSTSEIRAKEEGKILLSSFSLHLHTVLDYLKLKWKKDLEFILSLFVIDQIYTFLGLTG